MKGRLDTGLRRCDNYPLMNAPEHISIPYALLPISVCAVVVTYFPDTRFTENLDVLLPQIGHCVVVDNGSPSDTIAHIKIYAAQHPTQITFIENPENNLAQAQNVGIRWAQQNGYAWVLLLDQDSTPAPDMVAKQLAAYAADANPNTIAIIAPALRDPNTSHQARYVTAWHTLIFRREIAPRSGTLDTLICAIASGSLIPIRVFDEVGLMDESFVIDYIDKDFSLRCVCHGFRILLVADATLTHRFGKARDHHVMGAIVTTRNHTADRRYTIYRNRVRTWRRYLLHVPAFVAFDAMAACYDLARLVLFEQDKRQKLFAIARGIRDGIRR